MRLVRQTTIRAPASCAGVGLHSGVEGRIVARPAAAGTGIVFVRTDGPWSMPIPARLENVVATTLCTTLGRAGAGTVGTVEHLMATFAALEIDNAVVEVSGPEIPAMDGSAAPFVELIDRVGVLTLDLPRRVVRVLKPVTARKGDRWAALTPADHALVSLEIVYEGPPINRQRASFRVTPEVFRRELAPARTYGFIEDIESLRARGFALGGTLDNAVVVGGQAVLNVEGLRFPDEFVRHKILDAIGDLGLAGFRVIGHFHGQGSGHALNLELLGLLFADASAHAVEAAYREDDAAAGARLAQAASA